MKVFVAEYVCGGGFSDTPVSDIPCSLLSEGKAMLKALCHDCSLVAQTVTAIDDRLAVDLPDSIEPLRSGNSLALADRWLQLSADCDAVILIVPETDQLLASYVSMFRDAGRNVIACDLPFIEATGNKHAFSNQLRSSSVPHPGLNDRHENLQTQWIAKPVDGCGSFGIEIFDTRASATSRAEECSDNLIIQPLNEGTPVSVAAICIDNQIHWLPPVQQDIDPTTFAYQGGCGPLRPELAERTQRLASQTLEALPGHPGGYIGVDLVLGHTSTDDVVIEVNPRLTTSYVGLRRLMKSNLAAKMIGLDSNPLERTSNATQVAWKPDGAVTVSD